MPRRDFYDNSENDTLAAYQREKRQLKDGYFPRNAVIFQKLWLFAMKKPIYIPVRDKVQYRGLMTRLFKCLKPILNDKRIRWARQNLKCSLVEYGGRPCLRLGYDETLMEVKRVLADLYREHDMESTLNPANPYEELSPLYEQDFIPDARHGEELEKKSNDLAAKERREFYRVLGIVNDEDYKDAGEEMLMRMQGETLYSPILDEIDIDTMETTIPKGYADDMHEQEAEAEANKKTR